MTSSKTKYLLLTITLSLVLSLLGAEQLAFPSYKISIDFPAGWSLADKSEDNSSYLIANDAIPVTTAIRFYKKGEHPSAVEALNTTLNKLNADGDSESFVWRNTDSAVAVFTMTLSNTKMSGYGVAAVLPENLGTVVEFAWCKEEELGKCNSFIVSTLDSLCIDDDSYFEPGIMTTYLFPEHGKKKVPVTLEIDGKKVSTEICADDSEASNYVIEREYSILLNYTQHTSWKEAWLRYYRMIFRDSFNRMQRPAFDIYNALAPSCTDETDLAQKLLTWTQSFSYERAKSTDTSDFTSLTDILLKKGSDCDSRSMLISVLLQNMDIDSIFFISAEYSHAMCGLVSTHPGQSFSVNGKEYLAGETTAKTLTWGMISQNMADRSKWFPVTYPY